MVARASVPLMRKGLNMLLDRALESDLVERIRDLAMSHSGKVNGLHELKTRRSGDTNFVEFHLVFDEDIRLREAHRIADEIEMRIRKLEKARWIVNIHLDPVDDSRSDRTLAKSGLEGKRGTRAREAARTPTTDTAAPGCPRAGSPPPPVPRSRRSATSRRNPPIPGC